MIPPARDSTGPETNCQAALQADRARHFAAAAAIESQTEHMIEVRILPVE